MQLMAIKLQRPKIRCCNVDRTAFVNPAPINPRIPVLSLIVVHSSESPKRWAFINVEASGAT